jgi:hypothetical protein
MVGLIVGIFLGRRAATVATPQPTNGAMVADLIQRVVLSSHNGVVLLNSRNEASTPEHAAGSV